MIVNCVAYDRGQKLSDIPLTEVRSQLARSGSATPAQYDQLVAMATTLRERDAVEAIVLAGTDLAMLFNETNTPFPHLDCARAHIQAIMRAR